MLIKTHTHIYIYIYILFNKESKSLKLTPKSGIRMEGFIHVKI